MKVFYNSYVLTPKKKANRLSSRGHKNGILLKAILGEKIFFADYFPHAEFGDRTNEIFLEEFKFQNNEYEKKVFHHLLKDQEYQKQKPKTFFNHQLWSPELPIKGNILKYKVMDPEDLSFLSALESNVRVRLDFNGLFETKEQLEKYLSNIPERFLSRIDYLEDPLSEKDWKDLKLPCAQDFIHGEPFDFKIYKPNREFPKVLPQKIIYSSYMGEDLGRYHAYCEMISASDLSLVHGIVTRGLYEEEKEIFTGDYHSGFSIDKARVEKLYQWLFQRDWKLLCSM